MDKVELISFKLCPYVQRLAITLLKKGVDYGVTYIDLANKPDWFLAVSPLGKVPVLRTGTDVLFESSVINEFIDETTDGSLLPDDPVARAKARAWIVFVDQIFQPFFRIIGANSETDLEEARGPFLAGLSQLEARCSEPFFLGGDFSLVDSAMAPLFTYLNVCESRFGFDFLSGLPRLSRLSEQLLAQDYVQKSVVAEFEEELMMFMKGMGSHLLAK